MLDDRSDVRVRSLGRKGKLILVIIVVGMGLVLFLRVFSIFSPHMLPTLTNSVLSFLGGATFLTMVVIVSLSLLLVSGKRRLANCSLRRLILPNKRTNVMIPSVSGDGSTLTISCSRRKDGCGGFAISMLRLLSVPREGVRQRVRGAVARDELEEGAAVSDEKQYQFSHLESLSQSEGEGCVAYEVQFKQGLINVGFTVSSEDGAECRRRSVQVKANVLSKFPIQLTEASGERLKNAALMGLPWGVFQVKAARDKVAQVSSRDFSGYVAVVALRGRPEMAAHEQRCQIDQLITGINSALKYCYQGGEKEQLVVSLVVSFQASKPPKYPSDASLREKLREKPEVKLSLERKKVEVDAMEVEFGHRTGWWKVSTYAVIVGRDRVLVDEKADSVANIVRSVWSGSHFSPECTFLRSKEVVKYLSVILRRGLLPRRYVTGMSSVRLSSLVYIPEEAHPPLSKVTPPPFEAPDPEAAFGGAADRDGVVLGDVLSPVGGGLYPLTLPVNALGTHMVVFGETGSGKTCEIMNLLVGLLGSGEDGGVVTNHGFGGGVPFLVLDQKGEYRCLISRPEYGIAFFLPTSQIAPLWINLFDPQGDDPDAHAKRIFNIIREILFANRTELTPQMERVLYDVLRMSIGGDWAAFNENLSEFLRVHGGELPQLESTIQGILNRVGQFTRPPLDSVFNCKASNVYFPYLIERSAIIDLSEVRRQGTPEDVRLIANIIGKYVSVASLNRGADFGGELKHLFVVDDALDVVPEVLMKKTTADVGTIEYMAILLRATGQGLVVVSQRPNIAENVMGNSAVKVFFRTVVDARELAMWVNMSEEQAAYLRVLPKQEAIVTVPQHSAPMRIRIPDVGNIIRRKVTNHEIIVNNMINYPLMYDMQTEQEGEKETRRVETSDKTGSEERWNEEGEVTEEKYGEDGGEQEQGTKQEQREMILGEDGISKLASSDREAWSKLRDYIMRGVALDSDFVSKLLGISQPAAHRVMLSFRSAGLVGVAKIPNYAYGEGYQYVYYSPNKTIYGSGVVGYLRERIYEDLTGREAVASLSPKDVPSADVIVQNSYPLIIHAASSNSRGGLRLPALNKRIQKVADEFITREGLRMGDSTAVDTGRVIVVTLWRKVAEELNEARREGKLKGCLCVIPFAKKSVDTLADYVLHHIPLQTLLGEQQEEEQEENGGKERKDATKEEKKDEVEEEMMLKKGLSNEGVLSGEGAAGGTIWGRVLSLVRELGGVEPRVVAGKLGVPLWKVSRVARRLKDESVIKVALNIPDLRSVRRANATFYLDGGKPTALHDAVMNMIWEKNVKLGGRSRDFSFQHKGKTWHTDGLLENTSGSYILEVVAGEYDVRVVEQLQAYSTQIGHMGIKGIISVVLNQDCLQRIRKETESRGTAVPESGLAVLTTLRSSDEKKQLENLLLRGKPMAYHRNPTSC